jgi:hypothetical protein
VFSLNAAFFALEWLVEASFSSSGGFDWPVDGFHRPRSSAVRRTGLSPPRYLRYLGDRKYQVSSTPLSLYFSVYVSNHHIILKKCKRLIFSLFK